ncbi:meiotic cell cortex C-terminal pleckstrin homology-domain-containing protein [Absidia repens]|uniref:Meiotic cell cortex C-terminal pleckstrin homology-domain-containing protein n=1 Tax=Absidia repens TaxID=90262 RepID=A0A1X2ID81_9FUNG|nr:meiotic cell cortex C-terminal pleckstrin homology-domain-containing protein [Absidia repens]
MGVQSDLVCGADVGVQSDAILATPVEEKGVQTDNDDERQALVAPMTEGFGELSKDKVIDDGNMVEAFADGSSQDRDVKDSKSDNNAGTSNTMAALLASGAAALGLGAFARGNDSNDDSKPVLNHHDRSIQKNEQSPSSQSTDDKDDLNIEHSKSTDANPVDDTERDLSKSTNENVDDDINHDMNKESDDSIALAENDKQPQPEERTITRSEADDMIAAAVASALKKHQDEQVSAPSQAVAQQHLDANVSPLSALKASSIAKSLELTNDKRHTCDMSANEHHVTGGDNTRLSSDSKRSLSTDATTTTGSLSGTTSNNTTMEDHHSLAPGRPSSPPPPALLARSSMVIQQQNRGNGDRTIYPENSKGKWPMNQPPSTPTPRQSHQSDSNVETEDSRHHHATSPTHMARVNPNYFTKGNDHGSNDSYYNNNNNISATGTGASAGAGAAGAAASTLSFASSQQQPQQTTYPNSSATNTATTSASSPLAEPTIALITDTMMGHWLRKSPRNSGLLRNPLAQPHQRYVWMHPYTRTLYWSTHAPGTPNRDGKTKSAFIESMKVVPNPDEHLGSPQVSIQVSTSEGDMNLTAPDMNTHNTWAESLSYILSTSPESPDTRRMMKPRPTLGDEDSSRKKTRTSLLQDLFNHTNSSNSTTASKPSNNRHSMHNWPTSSERRHHGDIVEENDSHEDDDHVEQLEDLRMCCNGKHHLSHLERDRIHPNRPKYPKRSFRHSVAVGY